MAKKFKTIAEATEALRDLTIKHEHLENKADRDEQRLNSIADLVWGRGWLNNYDLKDLHGDLAIKLVEMKDAEVTKKFLEKTNNEFYQIIRLALNDPTLGPKGPGPGGIIKGFPIKLG